MDGVQYRYGVDMQDVSIEARIYNYINELRFLENKEIIYNGLIEKYHSITPLQRREFLNPVGLTLGYLYANNFLEWDVESIRKPTTNLVNNTDRRLGLGPTTDIRDIIRYIRLFKSLNVELESYSNKK